MKHVIRAAGIGFGGTIGAGAAIILGGALVAVLTRSAVQRTISDALNKVGEYVDQAIAEQTAATSSAEPDPAPITCPNGHVHSGNSRGTCDQCEILGLQCGATFGGGQGRCVRRAGHLPADRHSDHPVDVEN